MAAIMKSPTLRQIEAAAESILATSTDASTRVRLLRDVLRVDTNDRELRAARRELNRDPRVLQLASEQRLDGSWGRFHSRDTRSSQKIPTTEAAVARALELGLEPTHPILRRAQRYIVAVLNERITFPESEKNNRWPTGWRLFAAATLATIAPRHRAVDPVWNLWSQIAQQTFVKSRYDPRRELEAHRRLTGIDGDLRYLHISNKYALTLLGARAHALPPRTERAMLRWLSVRGRGSVYLSQNPLPRLEILSHFPSWRGFFAKHIRSLWPIKPRFGDPASVLTLLRRFVD